MTIIMYHYVRELPYTQYPKIKGLKVSEFKKQLTYLKQSHNFVTVEQCREAIYGNSSNFPENAALLTFDDGYKEHFTEVFPLLDRMGIQGAFFPPAQAILEHKVLDVNKIHFVLASANNPSKLVDEIHAIIANLTEKYQLKSPEHYWNKLKGLKHRYDPHEVVYIKRLLQYELPIKPRTIILDELFDKYIDIDEQIFARGLYMSSDQIKCMLRNGMYIGGHGYSHQWLNTMTPEEQKYEIDKTVDFLTYIGTDTNSWVMCYPYGAYNQKTIELLKAKKCKLGLTTEVNKASLDQENAFKLARMDTNDFPGK